MELRTITDISTEPVTLAEARLFITPDTTSDSENAMITAMIKSAREMIEEFCDLTLGEKTIQVFYHADEVEAKRVRLPAGPHSAMTSGYPVRINQIGTETAMVLNTDYYKRGDQFWELEFLTSSVNPWGSDVVADDYKIRLVAGYGTSGLEALPSIFEDAIKQQVWLWYLRGDDNPVGSLSNQIKSMISKFSKDTWI